MPLDFAGISWVNVLRLLPHQTSPRIGRVGQAQSTEASLARTMENKETKAETSQLERIRLNCLYSELLAREEKRMVAENGV